jgi:hypothetical protein
MLSTLFSNKDVRQTLDQFRRSVDQIFENFYGLPDPGPNGHGRANLDVQPRSGVRLERQLFGSAGDFAWRLREGRSGDRPRGLGVKINHRRETMRRLFSIALTSLWVAAFASGQAASPQATTDLGLKCFENLQTPEFPKSALQARVDGSVWSWAHVNAQGAIEKVDTQVVSAYSTGPKFLTAPVEQVLKSAKVRPECNGKVVSVVFRYQLHGEATQNPKVTTRTEGANLMWIESQPELASAAPAK